MTITSFTLPSEITTHAEAVEYQKVWARKVKTLPSSAPSRLKKAYDARLVEANLMLRKGEG